MRLSSLAASALLLATHASAAIIFTDDFAADMPGTAPANFNSARSDSGGATGSRSGSLLVQEVGGQNVARHTTSVTRTGGSGGIASIHSQSVALASVPGINFTVTTQFTLNSTSATALSDTITHGLIALAPDAAWGANTNSRYQLGFNMVGNNTSIHERLLLQHASGGNINIRDTSATALTPTPGTTYTLTLTGTYATPGNPASALTLFGSLADGTDTLTVSYVDNTPLQGDYFGIRSGINRATNGTASSEADFHHFQVIPEPSAALLGGLGLLALLRPKRA